MSILATPFVADSVARLLGKAARPVAKRGRRFPEIPGRTGSAAVPTRHGEVAVTIYRPPAEAGDRPPVYVNAHGGGFVIPFPEQDDPLCRYLAEHAGVVVVNVDYAVAPEKRFPVAVEQVYDVLKWAASPERDWNGEKVCVGGQSAGGALAAGAARLALENGVPEIALQVLHYPPLDIATSAKDKPAPGGRKVVIKPWMSEIFDTAYIPDAVRRRDRLASPAWGTNGDNLGGIAPALVITPEFDRQRAEGVAYAGKLEVAGSLVEQFDVTGEDHGYAPTHETTETGRKMYEFIAGHVRRATANS